MKKLLLLLPLLFMTGCSQDIGTGTLNFNYVYVRSSITGEHYYHIKRWKEYNPEGLTFDKGTIGNYVGLEITTYNEIVYYWYEQNLEYVFTKGYVPDLGTAIE